jgi:hypothetical protein
MDKPISSALRTTFLVHCIFGAILGAGLFLVPGRLLTLLGWVEQSVQLPESELVIPGTTFVDAIIVRSLGAALLGLAFSSFLGWRAGRWSEVALIVQSELVYCVLGFLALVSGLFLLDRAMPAIGYALMALLAAFAIAWGLALRQAGRA